MVETDELDRKQRYERIKRTVGQRLNQEKGSTGAIVRLKVTAVTTLEEFFFEVCDCILVNILEKHLPSVKLLVDLANLVNKLGEVPESEYQSLAEVLWKAWKELEEEPGTENGE